MKADHLDICVKQSRQVRRFTSSLDSVEYMIFMEKMNRKLRFSIPSHSPRITAPFVFNGQMISVIWRYHGERTASKRKIYHFDHVFMVQEKPHGYLDAIKTHTVAAAVVSAVGAAATYVYQNWVTIKVIILRIYG